MNRKIALELAATLAALGDLAAFAEDNAVMVYPRSHAVDECMRTLHLIRARIRELAEQLCKYPECDERTYHSVPHGACADPKCDGKQAPLGQHTRVLGTPEPASQRWVKES